MKQIFTQILAIITLMVVLVPYSQSADVFSHTVLTMPDDLRIDEPWIKVIQSQEEWEAYFYSTTAAVTYLNTQAPVVPEIDFTQYQVITGGLGIRSSGGYSLVVESVRMFDSEVVIHVLDIRAGSNCLVTAWITHPSITIVVKKTDTPIKYTISELIRPCTD